MESAKDLEEMFDIFSHLESLKNLFDQDVNSAKMTSFRVVLEHEILKNQKWREKIPFISWPSHWEVMPVPCVDALLRGVIRLKDNHSRMVSFYLDGYCVLGAVYNYGEKPLKPIPYWEIYNISENMGSDEEDQPDRFYLTETDKFLEGIEMMLQGTMKK